MPIDLRSDTVTLPSPEMRQAIANAALGDDVYGEDPTVNELEAVAAKMLGKEAGLFVASGTQGNLASLLAHCGRGHEVILGDQSHIYYYENGGASALGGIAYRPVPTAVDGTLPLDTLEAAIHSPAHNYHFFHYAPAGVICLENTHNRRGGVVLTPEYFAQVAALAARHGLPIHLDGARLFNAAVALGRPITDWTEHVSSIQLCLSKGLGAPVGSVIVGSEQFIWQARRMRKILGGGMRQAGIIAAGGLFALQHMVERLAEDHANAQILAAGIQTLPGVTLDPPRVETNIVVFNVCSVARAEALAAAVERQGVLVSDFGGGRLRLVTHYGITADDCHRAVAALQKAYSAVGPLS
ncbi:MAG: low-specificity L-threonine aldolase [Bacteroidales bacterium]